MLPANPQVSDNALTLHPDILDDLIHEIPNVSSVYHRAANTFVKTRKPGAHLITLDKNKSPASSPALLMEENTPAKVVLSAEKGEGMEVTVSFLLSNNAPAADFTITNKSAQTLGQFSIQFNFNVLGLKPSNDLSKNPLHPGQSSTSRILFHCQPPKEDLVPTPFFQVAIKNNLKIFYFQHLIPFKLYLRPEG